MIRWPRLRGKAEEEAERQAALDTLCRLSVEQRVPLLLRELCGLRYEHIGRVLEVPPVEVLQRIAEGREQLCAVVRQEQAG